MCDKKGCGGCGGHEDDKTKQCTNKCGGEGRGKFVFKCAICLTEETFRTDEEGYRGLAHLLSQAIEAGWEDDENKIINGSVCPGCCRELDELEGLVVQ